MGRRFEFNQVHHVVADCVSSAATFSFPAQIPRKWRSLFTSPLLISRRNPERSRWRLCRLTDAAGPLRVLRWVAVWVRRYAVVLSAIKEYRF